jgi:ATP synthase protein I
MNDEHQPRKFDARPLPSLAGQIGAKAERKLRVQRHVTRTVWFGLGMMGLVGRSVAVPTLLGAALGAWLDKHYSASHSWTLTLLFVGLVIGCLNAWHWVSREDKEIRAEQEIDDE